MSCDGGCSLSRAGFWPYAPLIAVLLVPVLAAGERAVRELVGERPGVAAAAGPVAAGSTTGPGRRIALTFDEERSRRVLGYEPPQVLLLHANELNADRLDALVAMIRGRGYRTIPLAEAVADPAYGRRDGYIGPRGLSWIHRWGLAEGLEVVEEPREPEWLREARRSLR